MVVWNGRLLWVGNGDYSEDGIEWNGVIEGSTSGGVSFGSTAAVHNGAIYAFTYNQGIPLVVRTTDHVTWTELNGGNVFELQVFNASDVRLVSFAGYLWLGGQYKTTYLGAPIGYGAVFRSLDGQHWEEVYIYPDYRTRFGAPYAVFGDSLYTIGGGGPGAPAYRSTGICEEILGGTPHDSDITGCGVISLSELLRVIQLFSTLGYGCDPASEDGYVALAGTASFALAGFPDPVPAKAGTPTLLTAGLHVSPKGEEAGATEGTAEGEGTADGASEGEGAPEGSVDGEGTAEDTLEGEPCTRHSADYQDPAWQITLPELLRTVQMYNAGRYHPCPDADPATEDGFCIGGA